MDSQASANSTAMLDRPASREIEMPAGNEPTVGHDSLMEQSSEKKEMDHSLEHENSIPLNTMRPAAGSPADVTDTTANESKASQPPPQDSSSQPPGPTASDGVEQQYIGPAKSGFLEEPPTTTTSSEPAIYTTLCVANTENRHRWKITSEYLRRRGEHLPSSAATAAAGSSASKEGAAAPAPAGDELLDMTVAQLKRLLHTDWRADWEARPSDPGQIRLISMGEQLQENKTLRDHRFKVDGPPRPILLSLRKPVEEDVDAEADTPSKAHGGNTGPDGEPRRRMCGCCVVM